MVGRVFVMYSIEIMIEQFVSVGEVVVRLRVDFLMVGRVFVLCIREIMIEWFVRVGEVVVIFCKVVFIYCENKENNGIFINMD